MGLGVRQAGKPANPLECGFPFVGAKIRRSVRPPMRVTTDAQARTVHTSAIPRTSGRSLTGAGSAPAGTEVCLRQARTDRRLRPSPGAAEVARKETSALCGFAVLHSRTPGCSVEGELGRWFPSRFARARHALARAAPSRGLSTPRVRGKLMKGRCPAALHFGPRRAPPPHLQRTPPVSEKKCGAGESCVAAQHPYEKCLSSAESRRRVT
jgi:hypothetical protein